MNEFMGRTILFSYPNSNTPSIMDLRTLEVEVVKPNRFGKTVITGKLASNGEYRSFHPEKMVNIEVIK